MRLDRHTPDSRRSQHHMAGGIAVVAILLTIAAGSFRAPTGTAQEETNLGTIDVRQYSCGHWVEPHLSAPVPDVTVGLQDLCPRTVEPLAFTVTDGGSYRNTLYADDTFTEQRVRFADVPATTVILSVSIPDGYHPPRVFCKTTGLYREQGVLFGNHVVLTVEPARQLTCRIFNIIATDYIGTLEFGAYDCERALEPDASFGQYIDTCATAPMSGIEFRVTGIHDDPDWSIPDTTNSEGRERILNIMSGADRSIELTESVPVGYSEPVVWCDSQDGAWARHDVNGGSVTLHDSDANAYSLACMFFNYAAYPRLVVTPIVPDPGLPVPVMTPIPQIPLPTPTPGPPELVVTPPLEDPIPILTPSPGIQLPSPTSEPPQLVVTPPVDYPISIETPAIQFPTPTPVPEVPTFEVIPVLPYPIHIVTPIPDEPIGFVPAPEVAANVPRGTW